MGLTTSPGSGRWTPSSEANARLGLLYSISPTSGGSEAANLPQPSFCGHADGRGQVPSPAESIAIAATELSSPEPDNTLSRTHIYAPIDPAETLPSSLAWQRRPKRKYRSASIHSAACLTVFALFIASTLGVLLLIRRWDLSFKTVNACDAGGNFVTGTVSAPGPTSFWAPSKAFQITLGFGPMSFRKAKLIDVAWDIVGRCFHTEGLCANENQLVGRAGQALLTYISYRVFTKSLSQLMAQSPITLAVFESITLRDATTLTSIFVLIKSFTSNSTTRARVSMLWIISASLYALLFQTLVSAMTGYSGTWPFALAHLVSTDSRKATTVPFIALPDGSQVPWSEFLPVSYIVHDGWRIKVGGQKIVTDCRSKVVVQGYSIICHPW